MDKIDKWIGDNPCRARRGSRVGTVIVICRECGHQWEGKEGYFLQCPSCNIWNPPKYSFETIEVARKLFVEEGRLQLP